MSPPLFYISRSLHGISYNRIIVKRMRIPNPSTREKIVKLLEWIAFTRRPLRVQEALAAVGIDPKQFEQGDCGGFGARILELCKPMIEVSKTGVVDFVHFSAKE